MAKNYELEQRKYVIGAIIICIVVIYIIRLFSLQITAESYKRSADNNAFFNKTLYPSRGSIYDRNKTLLVFNEPAYDVMVIFKEVENLDTLDFCKTLNIDKERFLKRIAEIKDRRLNPGYSQYTSQLFLTQLTPEECGYFLEKQFLFHGFYVQRRTVRQYAFNAAAHALGDMAEVSKGEMERDNYYVRGDYIGKQGVESSYEKQLRGQKGVEILLRDARGRIQGRFMDGANDKLPIAGKNLTLSLDIQLQLLAEELLQNKIGSVVAIEPATGEILCFASMPTFDPSTMVGKKRGQRQLELSKDPLKPLFNRASMAAYPPGSTFKPAEGLIFLQEKIITTSTAFSCHGGFVVPGMRVGCHAHGSPLALVPALQTSCNAFFCYGYRNMLESKKYGGIENALNTWKNHMVSMGFGYTLGIDLPGEKRGFIPNSDFYDKIYNKGRWRGVTVIHTAIGQGEVTTTPIQLANYCSTIANRGFFKTPHIVKQVEDTPLDSLFALERRTTIDRENYTPIVEGMRAAVAGGTCRAANIPSLDVCGKTGTAQNRGKDHSIFMGFAPKENPKIAIVVYIENGGFGATWAVPIGSLLIEKYLKGPLSLDRERQIKEISKANLIPYGFKTY